MTRVDIPQSREATTCKPLVSIVIPAYNAQRWIAETLASLKAQDFASFEVIVVDDGSTDDTSAIVASFVAEDHRFVAITQRNAGAGPARNRGMDRAQGRYLMFLDADDLFEPNLLSKMVDLLETSGADFAVCGADTFVDDSTHPLGELPTHRGLMAGVYELAPLRDHLYQTVMAHPWDKLIRASLVRAFDLRFQALPHSNDTRFVYAVVAHAQRMAVIDDVLVHYRRGLQSSLRGGSAHNPLCDLQAHNSLYEHLEHTSCLDAALAKSFDRLCVDVVIHDMAEYALSSHEALSTFCDAYFDDYEARFGLDDGRRRHYPHIASFSQAVAYACMRRLSPEGIAWACDQHLSSRASYGRSAVQKLALAVRLVIASMPGSPLRRKRLG